jgi:hypothetical protein
MVRGTAAAVSLHMPTMEKTTSYSNPADLQERSVRSIDVGAEGDQTRIPRPRGWRATKSEVLIPLPIARWKGCWALWWQRSEEGPRRAPTETLQAILDVLSRHRCPTGKASVTLACARLDRRRVLLHPAHQARRPLHRPRGRPGYRRARGSAPTGAPDERRPCDHDPVPEMVDVLVTTAGNNRPRRRDL